MYGAILGDIIGSRFEFDRGGLTKEFDLLTAEDNWTDDTVMTVAVAEALLDAGLDASVSEIEAACVKAMQKWGQKYPNAGYGGNFNRWVWAADPKPYGSYGNGSALPVSAVGWLYDSLERTREVARATANVTHNHPEGIKGAECTAAVMYLARTGASKEEIAEYVIREFGYDFSETLEEMRARHRHLEVCQDSLPKALRSFFNGESYEDVVRNAVSLGGDTDTLAAIAGAMAEAFYGMPILLKTQCTSRVNDDMREVLARFDREMSGDAEQREDPYADNAPLQAAFVLFQSETDGDNRTEAFITFLNILAQRMSEEGEVPVPYVVVKGDLFFQLDLDHVKAGDTVTTNEEVRLRPDTMTDGAGNQWYPLFLTRKEIQKGTTTNVIMNTPIDRVLRLGLEDEKVKGIVINPFDRAFVMTKEILEKILGDYDEWIFALNGK